MNTVIEPRVDGTGLIKPFCPFAISEKEVVEMNEGLRIAGYSRVSTQKQVEGFPLMNKRKPYKSGLNFMNWN
ncbi:hypothetical protein [Halobacillus litoralis]|uniref:Uncharacterized protein n=1 Tax=Halobacillus litoralis TaxID=45668 RepID=A0A410MIB1_9BACI|nr:hypothetical protein [Halobacillus litoralis]QAS54441.1 hypothetical protein HLI_20570 [Halobacillus litoralis]